MIQANEIRINNLVYDRNGDIHAIGANDFQKFRTPSMDGNPSGFKGIPLAEEILIKCGFEHDGIMWHKDSFIGLMVNDEKIGGGYAACLRKDNFYLRSLYTLHDLQNYWYYTTGTELEIEL